MKQLFVYLRKLHELEGIRLYWNLLNMMLISVMDGIGLYLLVPIMGIVGIVNMNTSKIPYISEVSRTMKQLPEQWVLPLVLSVYLAVVIGQAILKRRQTIQNIAIQQRFMKYLRMDTYRTIMEANWLFFIHRRKSDFSALLTSELARVNQGTTQTLTLITSLTFTFIQIGFALLLSWPLTLIVLGCGLGFTYFSRHFVRNAKALGDSTTELHMDYLAGVNEQFNGIKDIKSNALEYSHLAWFKTICRQIERNLVNLSALQATSQLRYGIASSVMIVTFVYLSVDVLHVSAGQLMLIIMIFGRLWPRFSSLQGTIEQIATSIPAFAKLFEIKTACLQARDAWSQMASDKPDAMTIRDSIEFRNVSFRYDKDSALTIRGVSLSIPANSMAAIVGKSGAGKSTLVDLLIGLLTPEQGGVFIDGRSLDERSIAGFRQSVSYVSQEPFLFNASIRDNMQLVQPNVSESQIWQALHLAASYDFVSKLPNGLDTVVGDRGVRLSGGERQRIVLARAILRNPSVLILDEATSALDNENEAIIQTALERLKGNMTIVVIAHRLSTIRNADQVIVLENGEVIQQGAYAQLAAETKGTFGKLLAFQEPATRTGMN
ncbi:ABC transporter ATP-binding protein [Paenibacillus lycopersici]|uniref:ABC transporter ATP-binding protein n=1 Tax=Paenibacillus lycopersici TaxID=2704462 RepID=UPI00177D923A|nr:ABC transporter ATP-binding protein [Paenibacillus lycopersici]